MRFIAPCWYCGGCHHDRDEARSSDDCTTAPLRSRDSLSPNKKKQPPKNSKGQGRFQHPECRWKDVSFVKTLLTKKVYDQQRLANAIRNSATGATSVGNGGGSSSTECGGHDAVDGSKSEELIAAGSRDGGIREMTGGSTGRPGEEQEVERTELEVATEAAVVRARGMGREARKELRQFMSR